VKAGCVKTRVRDDDSIPIAGGDAAEKFLAFWTRSPPCRRQDVPAGIQRQQLGENWPSMLLGQTNIVLPERPSRRDSIAAATIV